MMQWFNIDFFTKVYLILDPAIVLPKLELLSILNLDLRVLEKQKITTCIIDVNQTLLAYDEETMSAPIRQKVEEIANHFNCCILSNYIGSKIDDPNARRANSIRKQLKNVSIVESRHKKPSEKAFGRALELFDEKAEKCAVIGDRVFTDIIGANRMGMFSILVRPLAPKSDPFFYVAIPRLIENFFLKIYKLIWRSSRNGLRN